MAQAQKKKATPAEVQTTAAEQIMKELAAAVPTRAAEGVSPQTTKAIETAEEAVRNAIAVANQIPLSDEQKLERLGKEIDQSLKLIERMESQQLYGMEKQVAQIKKQLEEARKKIKTNPQEALKDYEQAQKKLEKLPDVLAAVRNLKISGAPKKMINATAGSLQFFGTDQQRRGELILRGANVFLKNQAIFKSPGGKNAAQQLAKAMTELADSTKKMTKEQMDTYEYGMDQFEMQANMMAAQLRGNALQAFEHQRILLQEQLAAQTTREIRKQIEATIEDIEKMVEKLKDEKTAAEVTDVELGRLARRTLDVQMLGNDLEEITSPLVRRQVGKTYAAALDVLAAGGSYNTYEMLLFSANEIKNNPGKEGAEYRKGLATSATNIGAVYQLPAEKRTAEQIREAEEQLGVLIVSQYADTLETAVEEQTGETKERLERIVADARDIVMHPERITVENAEGVRAALGIIESIKNYFDKAHNPSDEVKQGATAIYNRALGAVEGGTPEIAEMQTILAERYVAAATDEQRADIEKLSANLETNPELLVNARRYIKLDNQVLMYKSASLEALLKGTPAKGSMDSIIEALETVKSRIVSGEVTQEEIESIDGLTKLGNQMLSVLSETKKPDFRAEEAELFSYSINALIRGDEDESATYRDAALTYHQLGRSKVTEAREREVVMQTCRDYKEGKLDKETAKSILLVQQQRAIHESKITDSRLVRNVRAYFDFALMTAQKGGPGAQVILEMAVTYAGMAALPEVELTDEQKVQRIETMDFVHEQLGDYRDNREIARGKRISLIASEEPGGWKPAEGVVVAPVASAIVGEAAGEGTFEEILGNGDVEAGVNRLEELSYSSGRYNRLQESIEFENRFDSLIGKNRKEQQRLETRYARESERLMRKAENARTRGNEKVAEYYEFQATMSDHGFIFDSVESAREIYSKGVEEREKGLKLLEESRRTKDPARAEALKKEAEEHLKNSVALIEGATKILGGLERFDTSVRSVNTINRHRGRFELNVAVKTEIALANGYDVDLLGNTIEEGVPLTKERTVTLKAQAEASMRLGVVAVVQQQAVQRMRNRSLRDGKTNIHDANITTVKTRINALIGKLEQKLKDPAVSAAEKERIKDDIKSYKVGLRDAGDNVERLQNIYNNLGDQLGIATTYNAIEKEDDYQKSVKLLYGEKFRAAGRIARHTKFRMRTESKKDDARITGNDLGKEMVASTGGEESEYPTRKKAHIERSDEQKARDAREHALALVGYLPAAERKKYLDEIERIPRDVEPEGKDHERLQEIINEVGGQTVSFAGGEPIGIAAALAGGAPAYYDAESFVRRIEEAERLEEKGAVRAAETALGTISTGMEEAAAVQRQDNQRMRNRYMAWARNDQADQVPVDFLEGPVEEETVRARGSREDRNGAMQPVLDELEESYRRGAAEFAGAADSHERARDAIIEGGELITPSVENAIELAGNLSDEQLNSFVPGTEKTYRQMLTEVAETSISDPQKSRVLAQQLYMGIAGNMEYMGSAIAKIRSKEEAMRGFSESELLQMEAGVQSGIAAQRDNQRGVAWYYARKMLRDGQNDLRLADNSDIYRYEESEETAGRAGYHERNSTAHRENASRGFESALAALDEKNDVRFYEILVGNEELTAPIYRYEGKEAREWHDDRPIYITMYSEEKGYHERLTTKTIRPADELRELNISRMVSLMPYTTAVDAEAIDLKGKYTGMAEMQTSMELAQMGITSIDHGDGTFGLVRRKATIEQDEVLAKSYEQLTRIAKNMESAVFSHDTSWGEDAQESYIGRMYDRANQAHFAFEMGEEGNYAVAEQQYAMSVPFEPSKTIIGTYEDPDEATAGYIETMGTYAAAHRVTMAVVEFGVATAGIVLAVPTQGLSLGLVVGVGGLGIGRGMLMAEQMGEWTFQSGFQVGMGAMMMVLPIASEAVGMGMLGTTIAEEAGAQAAAGFGRKALQFIVGTPGMNAAQRTVHVAGLGMMGAGFVQMGVESGAMADGVESGQMPWWEAAFYGFQTVVQPLQIGLAARRGAVTQRTGIPVYRPRWVQTIEAVTMGMPFDPKHVHVMALSQVKVKKTLSKLPPKAQQSYHTYMTEQGYRFNPQQELAVVDGYQKAYESGKVSNFDQYITERPEVRVQHYENNFEALASGEIVETQDGYGRFVEDADTVKLTPVSEAEKNYLDARLRGLSENEALAAAEITPPERPPTSPRPRKRALGRLEKAAEERRERAELFMEPVLAEARAIREETQAAIDNPDYNIEHLEVIEGHRRSEAEHWSKRADELRTEATKHQVDVGETDAVKDLRARADAFDERAKTFEETANLLRTEIERRRPAPVEVPVEEGVMARPELKPEVTAEAVRAGAEIREPALLMEDAVDAAIAPEIAGGRTLLAGAKPLGAETSGGNTQRWNNGEILGHVQEVAEGIVAREIEIRVAQLEKTGMSREDATRIATDEVARDAVVVAIDKSGLSDIDKTTGKALGTREGFGPADVISRELYEHMVHRASDMLREQGYPLTADALLGIMSDERALVVMGEGINNDIVISALNQAKAEVNGQVTGKPEARTVPNEYVDPVTEARNRLREMDVKERADAAREGRGWKPITGEQEQQVFNEVAVRYNVDAEALAEHYKVPDLRTYQVEIGGTTTTLHEWTKNYPRHKNLIGDFTAAAETVRVKPGMEKDTLHRAYEKADTSTAAHTEAVSESLGIKGTPGLDERTDVMRPVPQPVEEGNPARIRHKGLDVVGESPGQPARVMEGDVVQVYFRLTDEGRATVESSLSTFVEGVANDTSIVVSPEVAENAKKLGLVPREERLKAMLDRFGLTAEDLNKPEVVASLERMGALRMVDMLDEASVGRVMQKFGLNQNEAYDLLNNVAQHQIITINQFARIVARKGSVFGTGDIGFSEGNTFFGHDGMNTVAQAAVDGVHDAVPLTGRGDDRAAVAMGNMTWVVPAGTDANAIKANVAGALENAGITGIETNVRTVKIKPRTHKDGMTTSEIRTDLTGEALGIEINPQTLDNAEFIVHMAHVADEGPLMHAMFGDRAEKVATIASEYTPPREGQPEQVERLVIDFEEGMITEQQFKDVLLYQLVQRIRRRRDLRRFRDVESSIQGGIKRGEGTLEQARAIPAEVEFTGISKEGLIKGAEAELSYHQEMQDVYLEFAEIEGPGVIQRYNEYEAVRAAKTYDEVAAIPDIADNPEKAIPIISGAISGKNKTPKNWNKNWNVEGTEVEVAALFRFEEAGQQKTEVRPVKVRIDGTIKGAKGEKHLQVTVLGKESGIIVAGDERSNITTYIKLEGDETVSLDVLSAHATAAMVKYEREIKAVPAEMAIAVGAEAEARGKVPESLAEKHKDVWNDADALRVRTLERGGEQVRVLSEYGEDSVEFRVIRDEVEGLKERLKVLREGPKPVAPAVKPTEEVEVTPTAAEAEEPIYESLMFSAIRDIDHGEKVLQARKSLETAKEYYRLELREDIDSIPDIGGRTPKEIRKLAIQKEKTAKKKGKGNISEQVEGHKLVVEAEILYELADERQRVIDLGKAVKDLDAAKKKLKKLERQTGAVSLAGDVTAHVAEGATKRARTALKAVEDAQHAVDGALKPDEVVGRVNLLSRRTLRRNKMVDQTGQEYVYLRKGKVKGREIVRIDGEVYSIVKPHSSEGGIRVDVTEGSSVVAMPERLKTGGAEPFAEKTPVVEALEQRIAEQTRAYYGKRISRAQHREGVQQTTDEYLKVLTENPEQIFSEAFIEETALRPEALEKLAAQKRQRARDILGDSIEERVEKQILHTEATALLRLAKARRGRAVRAVPPPKEAPVEEQVEEVVPVGVPVEKNAVVSNALRNDSNNIRAMAAEETNPYRSNALRSEADSLYRRAIETDPEFIPEGADRDLLNGMIGRKERELTRLRKEPTDENKARAQELEIEIGYLNEKIAKKPVEVTPAGELRDAYNMVAKLGTAGEATTVEGLRANSRALRKEARAYREAGETAEAERLSDLADAYWDGARRVEVALEKKGPFLREVREAYSDLAEPKTAKEVGQLKIKARELKKQAREMRDSAKEKGIGKLESERRLARADELRQLAEIYDEGSRRISKETAEEITPEMMEEIPIPRDMAELRDLAGRYDDLSPEMQSEIDKTPGLSRTIEVLKNERIPDRLKEEVAMEWLESREAVIYFEEVRDRKRSRTETKTRRSDEAALGNFEDSALARERGLAAEEMIAVYRGKEITEGRIAVLKELGYNVEGLERTLDKINQIGDTPEQNAEKIWRKEQLDKKVQGLFDLAIKVDMNSQPGFDGSGVENVSYGEGMAGVYKHTTKSGKKVFVKTENAEAGQLGTELIQAEFGGVPKKEVEITSRIHEGEAYETGITGPDGKPYKQEISIIEDVHDLAAGPEIEVTLADGRKVTATEGREITAAMPEGDVQEVTVVGSKILKEDILSVPAEGEALGVFANDPVVQEFYRLLGTSEGTQELMKSWNAYIERSRRIGLIDRAPRNTAVLMVKTKDNKVRLLFVPIDVDYVGGKIVWGPEEGTFNFDVFENDFVASSRDFLRRTSQASDKLRERKAVTESGEPLFENTQREDEIQKRLKLELEEAKKEGIEEELPDIEKQKLREKLREQAEMNILAEEMFSDTAMAGGRNLPPSSEEVRTDITRIVDGHDGKAFGPGYDALEPKPDQPGIGSLVLIGGEPRITTRPDGRLALKAKRMNKLLDTLNAPGTAKKKSTQENFWEKQRGKIAPEEAPPPPPKKAKVRRPTAEEEAKTELAEMTGLIEEIPEGAVRYKGPPQKELGGTPKDIVEGLVERREDLRFNMILADAENNPIGAEFTVFGEKTVITKTEAEAAGGYKEVLRRKIELKKAKPEEAEKTWQKGVPENAERVSGKDARPDALLGIPLKEVGLPREYNFAGGYDIEGARYIAFRKGKAKDPTAETILVKQLEPGAAPKEVGEYYIGRLKEASEVPVAEAPPVVKKVSKAKPPPVKEAKVAPKPKDTAELLFINLADTAAKRSPGKSRKAVNLELNRKITAEADRLYNQCHPDEKIWNPPSDEAELLTYITAWRRAQQEGRKMPTKDDFKFGALVTGNIVEVIRSQNMMHVANPFLSGLRTVVARTSVENIPQAISGYTKIAVGIAEKLPASIIIDPVQFNAEDNIFKLATFLYLEGVKDPLSILTNGHGTGLLDIFPATGAGGFERLNKIVERVTDLVERIPKTKRAEMAEPTIGLIFEDMSRLNPDVRELYLQSIESEFRWSGDVEAKIRSLDQKGRDKTGRIRLSKDKTRMVSARTKRQPVLAYMMAPDKPISVEAMARLPLDQQVKHLISGIDSDVVGKLLSNKAIFADYVEFIKSIREARSDPNGKYWLKAVREQMGHEPIRKHFISNRIRHLTNLWKSYQEGLMRKRSFIDISKSLAGRIEASDFNEAIVKGYLDLAPELKISKEWAAANIDLVIELIGYREILWKFEAVAASYAGYVKVPFKGPKPTRALKKYAKMLFPGKKFKHAPEYHVARQILDDAFTAHMEGRFAEFKYSPEFQNELRATYGEKQGDAIFQKWKAEEKFEITATTEKGETIKHTVYETGTFESGFFSGIVRGATACQNPRNQQPAVGGIVGSIAQPWAKQVVIKVPGSEASYTRWIILVHGDNGKPIILVQPPYQTPGTPKSVDAAVVKAIGEKYAGTEPKIEVRIFQGAKRGPDIAANGKVLNRGFTTYEFRAPFVYIDSNMKVFVTEEGLPAQNGFYTAEIGGTLSFPNE